MGMCSTVLSPSSPSSKSGETQQADFDTMKMHQDEVLEFAGSHLKSAARPHGGETGHARFSMPATKVAVSSKHFPGEWGKMDAENIQSYEELS